MSSPTPSETARPGQTALEPEVVIRLDDASLCYRRPSERIASVKDYSIKRVTGQIEFTDFWALRDVSLDVRRGGSTALFDVPHGYQVGCSTEPGVLGNYRRALAHLGWSAT